MLASVFQCLADALQHDSEGDAAVGMCLRIEEGFGVHHVLFAALQEIGPGQVVEVLFGAQHVGAHVVQVQEFLKIAVVVGAAQGIDVGPGERHAVALRQLEQ
ncbi:hypothetical protein D3C73_1458770 [compost metagenome]